MMTLRDALIQAHEYQQNGNLPAAEALYRRILVFNPEHAVALNNLGLIVAEDQAVDLFRRAIAAVPNYVQALINLAIALQNQGQTGEAVVICERALAIVPDDPNALFHCGQILEAQGKFEDAAARYEHAATVKPDFASALVRLATVNVALKRHAAAIACYHRVLAMAPDSVLTITALAAALQARGQLAEARKFRDRIPRPRELLIHHAAEPKRTVLLLGNQGKGNVPLQGFLSPDTDTCVTWHVEFATDAQAAALPPYDVAINGIGDADVIDESAARVDQLHAIRPVLNPAHAIARTRRDRMPQLLAGIDHIIVPPVTRLAREARPDGALVAKLAANGIAWPMLVRPIVSHGGEDMVRVENAHQLAALKLDVADAYYFTAYHDCQAADGCYRKYRMIFVDRQPFAYHLAISPHWMVHYFSAEMEADWKRDEEREFLLNPTAVLGPRAMAAITAIGHRLDLDFAGIDFSILPDGRVLVFEANATMLVHLRDSADAFPYKHAVIPAIFNAFESMLNRHQHRYPPSNGEALRQPG